MSLAAMFKIIGFMSRKTTTVPDGRSAVRQLRRKRDFEVRLVEKRSQTEVSASKTFCREVHQVKAIHAIVIAEK